MSHNARLDLSRNLLRYWRPSPRGPLPATSPEWPTGSGLREASDAVGIERVIAAPERIEDSTCQGRMSLRFAAALWLLLPLPTLRRFGLRKLEHRPLCRPPTG